MKWESKIRDTIATKQICNKSMHLPQNVKSTKENTCNMTSKIWCNLTQVEKIYFTSRATKHSKQRILTMQNLQVLMCKHDKTSKILKRNITIELKM